MWSITIGEPDFADERLASLSVEIPTNTRNDGGFGLLVGLWCGLNHLGWEEGAPRFRLVYGLLAGELKVTATASRISNIGRYKKEAYKVLIARSEKETKDKWGKIGATISSNVVQLLQYLGLKVETGGHLNKTVTNTEQRGEEYYQIFWRVADAGHDFWRVHGIGMNKYGVLQDKVTGDEPLCYLTVDDGVDTAHVDIIFSGDLRDLCVMIEHEDAHHDFDSQFRIDNDKHNRELICGIVLGKALTHQSLNDSSSLDEGRLLLARQALTADRKQS